MLRRRCRSKISHFSLIYFGKGQKGSRTILGRSKKLMREDLHCVTCRGVCRMSPDQKMVDISFSEFFFLGARWEFEKVGRKASQNFKTSLWQQKGFLEDWATSKFPDICDSFLGAVHIAPLKCISAVHNVQPLELYKACKVQMQSAISAMQCPDFNSSWLQRRQQIVIRANGEEEGPCHSMTYR